MLDWTSTLRTVQLSPAANAVQERREPAPKTAALESLRRRNAILDGLFYDVGTISQTEAAKLSPWLAAEGAIVVVHPSGMGPIAIHHSVEAFVAAEGSRVTQLAVAGVGSSALGSAAFARNVADATGMPVAAVVSGYGLADLVTEALGGYFWFGTLNGIRHQLQILDDLTSISRPDGQSVRADDNLLVRSSRDTQTVLDLLRDKRLSFNLLIGHSKGNLVVSEALFELLRTDANRAALLAQSTRIVTVSAVIEMPRPFRGIVDVIGEWDWFGGLNSRSGIRPDIVVPHAWHHTNTELPAHLPVEPVLRSILQSATR